MKNIYFIFFFICSAAYSQNAFITTWEIPSSDLTIEFPFDNNLGYTIDYGDGTPLGQYSSRHNHTYATAGIYTVSVTSIKKMDFGSSPFLRNKLKSVEQWGTSQWTQLNSAFSNCNNLVINATDAPNLSQITILNSMFHNATSFNQSIDHWDVSNITNMSGLFRGAKIFNQPLNNWNVSNVTNMSGLFDGAENFNQPLNNWNVSNVTDMNSMFSAAYNFNKPLGLWNVSNVSSMFSTFKYAYTFNQPLDTWNVSNVTNMNSMFFAAIAFDQPLGSWDVSNVTSMSKMFQYTDVFNQTLNNWDVSNVINMSSMFEEAWVFNQPLDNWNISSVTNTADMFRSAFEFNQPLNDWNFSSVTNAESMFTKATNFNQSLNNWDVSNLINLRYMFNDAINFNGDLSGWNFASATNIEGLFLNASAFNQPINDWNVSNIVHFNNMFQGATTFNQPLNNWDTSSAMYFYLMFNNASSFDQDLSGWNYSNVWNFGSFFGNSNLSINNYEAILYAFVQSGLENKYLGADNIVYCNTLVRKYLIEHLGWSINGDIRDPECSGNTITGQVYFDQDANDCDPYDIPFPQFLVGAEHEFGSFAASGAEGLYDLQVFEGNYNVSLLNIPSYFSVSPLTTNYNFTTFNNSEVLDFCITANQVISDLSITLLPVGEARPGFATQYQLVVKNVGTQIVPVAAMNLVFDNAKQSFIEASQIPLSNTINQLNFEAIELQPFESRMIDITMQTFTPNTVQGGDILNFTATANPNNNDFTPLDNVFQLEQVVVNSFDPNDKRVLQGDQITIEQAGEYLDYIIRFQNTGTASAIYIRIEDTLDTKLDWTTLTPISASHDYRFEIKDGNQVKFFFDNIQLPSQEFDDEGSNGFIAYKIKPLPTIVLGDIISGNAAIYFDFNDPIITNTATTFVGNPLSISQHSNNTLVVVYPNPVTDFVNIQPKDGVKIEEVIIYNMQGQKLSSAKQNLGLINLQQISSGIYFLSVKTTQGNATYNLIKK